MNDIGVEKIYESYAHDSVYKVVNSNKASSYDKQVLAEICKRPEFRPLLKKVDFEISDNLKTEFSVDDNNLIKINSDILKHSVTAVFHIHHALEIVAVNSCIDIKEKAWVSAIVAFHTTVYFLEGMVSHEKEEILSNINPWIRQAVTDVAANKKQDNISVARKIGQYFSHFAGYQNLSLPAADDDFLSEIYDIASKILPVAKPVEMLAIQGGDDRLEVDIDSGLNQYGCSPKPRSWAITFSSCTSSTISKYAYWEIEKLRQRLISSAAESTLYFRCNNELKNIRNEMSSIFMLDEVPGSEVILGPSGTDVELYELYFAMAQNSDKAITNILISTTEVGSGTVYAAGGRHFNDYTPLSGNVTPGEPVEGFDTDRISVRRLELRDEIGQLHPRKKLDEITRKFVEEELANNRKVLLHLLDSSKTGIGGPSIEVVRELKRTYPGSVEVIVDAAQMRLGRAALHRYLKNDFMVLISGSKFFTGAPFSGGLIIPPSVSNMVDELESLPSGLSAYGTKFDFPARWKKISENLSSSPNIGMLFRWQSAMWEIKAFYSVSALDQFNTMNDFGQAILKIVDKNQDTELVMAPPPSRGAPDLELSWDQLPSIFTFFVYRTDHETGFRTLLTYDEARFAYKFLNMNIAKFLPVHASENDHYLASKRCHIGQPVKIHKEDGEWVGALRIATGARIVSGIQFDYALGSEPEERFNDEIADAKIVFNKLSLIVKYWEDLLEYDLENDASLDANFYRF